jgi:hypothetical protein
MGDFSVVLFRPHCMLVSEKNRMKVHKTQWLQAMPYSPECLSEATSRGRTMAPEAQMPAHALTGDNSQRCGLTSS